MTVLAVAARLACVLEVGIGSLADGLFVSNLGLTYVGLNVEFTHESVDYYLKMQLAHSGDDGLSGFLIGIELEGRILLGQLLKSYYHLLLACLGLGLYCNPYNRLGELHRFKNYRMILLAKCVTGGGILKTDNSGDVAGVAGLNILTVVCVHLKQSAHSLGAMLYRVEYLRSGIDLTGIHSEEAELSDERVGCNFKGKSREGLLIR